MTKDDFLEWLKFHCARFSGLAEWFEQQDDPMETRRAWFWVIEQYSLEEARNASNRMFSDADKHPKQWRLHPAAVKSEILTANPSSRSSAAMIDGERVFSCPFCEDSGSVTVWSIESLHKVVVALRSGETPTSQMMSAAAARCTCRAADRLPKTKTVATRKVPWALFDQRWMLRCYGWDDRESFSSLVERAETLWEAYQTANNAN